MKKSPLKTVCVLLLGVLGMIYLINPTAGVIELIPDNIPFIGNLDEAAAAMLFIGALRYFGLDITKFFNKNDIQK